MKPLLTGIVMLSLIVDAIGSFASALKVGANKHRSLEECGPYRCFKVSQDGVDNYVEPINTSKDAVTFYGYTTTLGLRQYSFDNPDLNDLLGDGTKSMIFLQRHCNNDDNPVNLFVVHGQAQETGGRAEMDITGLGSVAVRDDDRTVAFMDVLPDVTGDPWVGKWAWDACCTDGAAFNVPWNQCVLVNARFPAAGNNCITNWNFIDFPSGSIPPTEIALASSTDCFSTTIPTVEICEVGGAICLWPPNHKHFCIGAPFVSEENVGCIPSTAISYDEEKGCVSNQADNAQGDGNTINDCYYDTDKEEVCMLAERAGTKEEPREYTINLIARDATNEIEIPFTRTYKVPHDKGDIEADCPGGIIKTTGKKNNLRG